MGFEERKERILKMQAETTELRKIEEECSKKRGVLHNLNRSLVQEEFAENGLFAGQTQRCKTPAGTVIYIKPSHIDWENADPGKRRVYDIDGMQQSERTTLTEDVIKNMLEREAYVPLKEGEEAAEPTGQITFKELRYHKEGYYIGISARKKFVLIKINTAPEYLSKKDKIYYAKYDRYHRRYEMRERDPNRRYTYSVGRMDIVGYFQKLEDLVAYLV